MEEIEQLVINIREALDRFKNDFSKSSSDFVSSQSSFEQINEVCKLWFKIRRSLGFFISNSEIFDKYDDYFKKLIGLTYKKTTRKKGLLIALSLILSNYNNDILMPIQINSELIKQRPEIYEVLSCINNQDENEYLKEAIECAQSEHYRASIILSWCAVIDRIHRKIEQIGYDKFSKMTETMKNQKTGRFKRFSKQYNVTCISDLQEVFDSDILHVIEAFGLIDNNQFTRLSSCYTMRCHCSHPGKAPITKYNVMSYFSDITEIIFNNESLKLEE